MASTVPLVREYAYVVLRFNMSNSEDLLKSLIILCYYGDTNDVLHVDGLGGIDETPIETGTRFCRQLINFVEESNILSLLKVISGIKDLIPIRISMYIFDVKFGTLNMTYKNLYGSAELANIVNSLRDKILDDIDDYGFPPPIVSTTI